VQTLRACVYRPTKDGRFKHLIILAALRAQNRYLSYSHGDFEVFRPAGATLHR